MPYSRHNRSARDIKNAYKTEQQNNTLKATGIQFTSESPMKNSRKMEELGENEMSSLLTGKRITLMSHQEQKNQTEQ